MSDIFVKDTFGPENEIVIGVFGSSITGAYSFYDRWKSYSQTVVQYYTERGFSIRMKDYSINGGTLYSSRHSTYSIPAYVSGGRPAIDTMGRNLDTAIADGITHAFIFHDNNDTFFNYTDANPIGLNVFGEEQIDIFQNYIDICTLNSIVPIVATNNTSLADTVLKDKFKLVSDNMKSVWDASGQLYLDIFYTMADPANSYLGMAVDFFDGTHWNLDNGTGIGHGKVAEALKVLLNDTFSLLSPVWDLQSDTPCGDNPLVINELTGIAVTNELTGEFVINEVL